ncbi:hypothetical protein HDU67_009346 [Dinochytrium kinnereticum]|nr:hypothetical protein HDU67_009346 [Dinochytrium kinnereticum]
MKRSHDFISSIPKDINKRVRVAQAGYNNYATVSGNSMSYGANNDVYSQYSNQYMTQQMQMGSSMAMVGMSNLGAQYSNPNAMATHFTHGQTPEGMAGYGQGSYGQMGQYQAAATQQFGNQANTQMRTIYIGNLPPGTSLEEVMNYVKGGVVEQVKILEDKNCAFITFVEATSAFNFMNESQAKRIVFNGQDAKIGWGKASPCPPMIQTAVAGGATRNVFIGSVDETMTEAFLHAELSKFGPVDQVKILQEKRIAFVHMANIKDALTAVMSLQSDAKFRGRRIHYGKDRCAYNHQPVMGMSSGGFVGGSFMDSAMGTQNRTVYLGGIHAEATTKDLCDVIRGGILQTIKYMPDKNYAFVTFVDPNAALALVNRGNHEGVVIKGKRVKVAWGKASALPMNVATVVQGGASRNVYIGSLDGSVNEERLRKDFSEYGEIELVNMIPDRNIGFVNFTDILSAVRAVEGIKNNPEYAAFKISYGKDRCGNPPRPRPEGAGGPNQAQMAPPGTTTNASPIGSSAVVILPTVPDNGVVDEMKVEGQYMY